MKARLRHVKTRMFYSGWHNWTIDMRHAVNFETPEDAVQRARREMLSQMELVIQEGGSG